MDDKAPDNSKKFSTSSAEALRGLEERARSALSASREQVSRLEADITAQLDAISARLSDEQATDSRVASDLDASRKENERLAKELEDTRAAWLAERNELQQTCEVFARQVAQGDENERTARAEWKGQLEDFEERLRDQQSKWSAQRTELDEARVSLERERDGLQQKFELALQDVQRLRGRVAELEQDLARRPETNQADSAELVALRAERDALSERVEQLERQPAPQIDRDSQQQLADLQRRFELAVEDVRELKTANSKLEAKLAAAGKPAAAASASEGGSMDWEAQKRRLLASLEDEGDSHDEPARQKDRVTIEGTIEMTDAVVAEKDREIAELKSQLVSGGERHVAAVEEERQGKLSELIDSDEVIAEHRKRIAQIEREMEDKLRAAELELSLERAKIARQKVEVEEMRADLHSQRPTYDPNGVAPEPGAPRRRWLSKLGLSGEEQ